MKSRKILLCSPRDSLQSKLTLTYEHISKRKDMLRNVQLMTSHYIELVTSQVSCVAAARANQPSVSKTLKHKIVRNAPKNITHTLYNTCV